MKVLLGRSPYLWVPAALFLGGDLLLATGGLLFPSFVAIRLTYNFSTLVAPLLFAVGAVIGFAAAWRPAAGAGHVRAAWIGLLLAGLLLGIRAYASYIEPHRLQVRTVQVKIPGLRQPLRILHISDIQSAGIGRYEASAFNRMRALHPDLVLHTGDMLQPLPPATYASETPRLAALFRTLNPPLGCFGVTGDVDYPLRRATDIELGGLHLLCNTEAVLTNGETRIRLLGLERGTACMPAEARQLIEAWMRGARPGDINLLLGHSPDFAVAAVDLPIDLCLAGHTHGGQIRVPWYGPILTLTKYVPRAWARGFHVIGKTRLNVSAGIGSEHASGLPSIRVNCPPEMTFLLLEPGT
ncbi:MAG: metallophosphoesterase [bacterium]